LKEVDVMEAVTFLADVQRNETALIAATEYVNAYGVVLFFKLRREVSGNSMLSFGYLTEENGVYANLYDTIRYDTRYYFNVRSKADISQLNLPHGTDN